MHCIVTEMYYGGEGLTVEQPQAFTCPYCGRQGLTEGTLQEHVASEHADTSFEVVSYLMHHNCVLTLQRAHSYVKLSNFLSNKVKIPF
jgi:hypothetical protein